MGHMRRGPNGYQYAIGGSRAPALGGLWDWVKKGAQWVYEEVTDDDSIPQYTPAPPTVASPWGGAYNNNPSQLCSGQESPNITRHVVLQLNIFERSGLSNYLRTQYGTGPSSSQLLDIGTQAYWVKAIYGSDCQGAQTKGGTLYNYWRQMLGKYAGSYPATTTGDTGGGWLPDVDVTWPWETPDPPTYYPPPPAPGVGGMGAGVLLAGGLALLVLVKPKPGRR